MAEIYINNKRMVEGLLMTFEDDLWTDEDEEAYSDPSNHLPSDGLMSDDTV